VTLFTHILLLTICSLFFINSTNAGEQEKLDDLRQKILALQQEMEKTDASKADASDALRESERAISNSNRTLAKLTKQHRIATKKLNALRIQEKTLNNTITEQQAKLGKLLYRQYLSGQQKHLKLLFNEQNPNKVYRNFHYYQYIARDRMTWLDALRTNLTELNIISQSAQEQQSTLNVLRTKQATQNSALKKGKRAKQKVLRQISRQLKSKRSEINRLQRNEKRLASLVEKLAQLIAKPKALFRNDSLPDNRFDGTSFASLKGKLTLPVKGQVTNQYGGTRPDSPLSWKGLFLQTASGQTVKAVAAGRVIFADWLRGFGNLLIIDHGKDYMSLYGNNETLYKQVGDTLHGGDTIAATGNSGGNKDFGLYFELRYKSKPFDPMKWMTAQ
jgi:septal ring factor EnvC (AmiA/AmiB activator)